MNNKQNLLPEELLRVIDANLNRLKEGIRVIEDIMRYSYNNKEFSSKLKTLRHLAILDLTKELLIHRDSINDVLKQSTKTELNRIDLQHILLANFKRAEESCRVLEEIFKLNNNIHSEKFKHIRYELYDLEKQIILSI
jgi:thiamine-phosphate pyrophosphorylase